MDRSAGKVVGVHENTGTRLADASRRAESARMPEKVSNIRTGERFDGGLLARYSCTVDGTEGVQRGGTVAQFRNVS